MYAEEYREFISDLYIVNSILLLPGAEGTIEYFLEASLS